MTRARGETTEDVRLNRFLAQVGVGSRRACDDVIRQGRVVIDGSIIRTPGRRIDPNLADVRVDGARVCRPHRPMVLLLHKPTGVVSTANDPQGRTTVIDLCRKYAKTRRLFPVGRLDVNTTGALLVTNDGALCYRLTHPRYQVPKTYVVRVRGHVTARTIQRLRRMAGERNRVGDKEVRGVPVRPDAELTHTEGRVSTLRVTLLEGRNRQVRRMCEAVGLRVVKLKRVQFGNVSVRKLPVGAVRPLEPRELAGLRRLAGLKG